MDDAVLIAAGLKGLNICKGCGRVYDPKKEGDWDYCGECMSSWQFSSPWFDSIKMTVTVTYMPKVIVKYTFEGG